MIKLTFGPVLTVLAFAMLVPRAGADVITMYASDFSSQLNQFDTSSYSSTVKGSFSPSFFAGSLDFRNNGTLYGISTTLRTINTSNATNTQIGGTLPEQMSTLAFSPSDQIFAVSLTTNRLYQINPSTGGVVGSFVNIIGTSGFTVFGIDFAANGTLYATAADNLYTINTTTGAATAVATGIIPNSSPFTTGTIFGDIDIGSDGLLRGFISPLTTGNVTVATVDPTTGTLIGTSTVTGMSTESGLASAGPLATPEPSTMLLVGVGLPFVMVVTRSVRRRKDAAKVGDQ
jgi:PEP-CTERM motif